MSFIRIKPDDGCHYARIQQNIMCHISCKWVKTLFKYYNSAKVKPCIQSLEAPSTFLIYT
uniref:Uncharacterized protein n=1 Tax=Anguilla anguilla TaxID=7936 RepID=A0A0E9TBG0_ANGAN